MEPTQRTISLKTGGRVGYVLGTPLQLVSYEQFASECLAAVRRPGVTAVDFTNTQIVSLRRHEASFREITSRFDYFIPDGMPLIWCLNWQGAGLRDRVYGPTFMRLFISNSPAPLSHYFLGGSEGCLAKLQAFFRSANPSLQIAGAHHGYFKDEEEAAIVQEINALSPDFIWVGLGTPKQQAWVYRLKGQIRRGVIFAVGFAFDVNAGTKRDAPPWMQRMGLTWLFRMASEPGRLAPRYLRYNSLFLFYLLWDGLRGRGFTAEAKRTDETIK